MNLLSSVYSVNAYKAMSVIKPNYYRNKGTIGQ